MKTGFAILAGVATLSLAVGVGTATAATKHKNYRHHAAQAQYMQAPAAPQANYAAFEDNHNPAKKYPARHMPEGAIKTSTLSASGNNAAKPYAVRHAPQNAAREGTLTQSGNNPAKRYKSTTTGSAPR